MPVPVVTHTGLDCPLADPSDARPVTVRARNLDVTHQMQPHAHAWGQVTFTLEGVVRVTANNSSWVVPPQRAIWIPPGVMHAVDILEPAHLRPLFVLATRSPFPGNECRVLAVSPLMREMLMALEQLDQTDHGSRATLLCELILDEVPRLLTRPMRVPLPEDKRLASLCAALMADPGMPHTLETWASHVGASERTLARLFEKELGMTFGQWRQQVRLAHAAPMIARGVPLAQVAEQLGYASQSAFSAMFRKTFGTTPSAFFADGV
ncbi:helix-turn-helix transcriptional regulator [Pseudoduganella ginsengisoli]|uniref:Helix-turn-helix domain-containing protein n=1 Tax=Pseudoduganella ginsengisoli TaxID=1462440 RepID=A0A6L6PYZ9_9BURK|nr:helix-turn-helix transcriptional regulator [Pseudoduganella ginsengisoli]MTW02384.1 helix-turn-helix domain-containing protein [Pseudoduganella ginsengisoli]